MQALKTPGLVTVFGGAGFIGRYAVRVLAKDGWRVRVALRRPHLAPELRVMGDVGQIELHQANVRMADSVAEAVEGADAVVNLVGSLYSQGPQTYDALHVKAARAVAEAAAAHGARRLIHVSALGADARSASNYFRTKAEGEAAVKAAFANATIVRPSIVFGEEDQFFNKFAAMAGLAPALPLIGGGKTLIQAVYAGDVGAAIAAALLREDAPGKTYEIGGAKAYTFRALMEIMLAEIHRRRALVPLPFDAAALIGMVGDGVGAIGLEPPLTSDQVRMLMVDNVVAPDAPGLADLDLTPTALEAILPTYLWKYRVGGQFAQPATANASATV